MARREINSFTYHFCCGHHDDPFSRICPWFCVSVCAAGPRVLSNGFDFSGPVLDPANRVGLASFHCDRLFGAVNNKK